MLTWTCLSFQSLKHLDDYMYSYSCGAKLEDLDLGEEFKNVEIRDHACGDMIEKLFYSAGLEPTCIYCGIEQLFTSSEQYPQCEACSLLPTIKK